MIPEPLRLPHHYGEPTPPELLADWLTYRLAERAEFDAWLARRPGIDPELAAEFDQIVTVFTVHA